MIERRKVDIRTALIAFFAINVALLLFDDLCNINLSIFPRFCRAISSLIPSFFRFLG